MKKYLMLLMGLIFTINFNIFANESDKVKFIDSANREVAIPKNISKFVPSGTNAQLVLVGFAGDKMVGISKKQAIDVMEKWHSFPKNLPVLGQYYGKSPNFNKEELIKLDPELIIDIGEKKATIVEDLNQIFDNTAIATIFIELTPDTTAKAYRTLGKIFNREEKAEKIAKFFDNEVNVIKNGLDKIATKDRKTFIQIGNNAQTIDPKNSSHTEAIEFAGGVNKAPSKQKGTKSKTEVLNMEEVYIMNPDMIFAKDKNTYDIITTDARWSKLSAVKNKNVYLVPTGVYSYVTNPPSVNKMLGVYWAAQVMYPKYFKYDISKIEKEFNELVYGI